MLNNLISMSITFPRPNSARFRQFMPFFYLIATINSKIISITIFRITCTILRNYNNTICITAKHWCIIRSIIMAQLSRQKFDIFIMNWYVDELHGKCVKHLPDFYIMRLLWLHPEALPDSIPRQAVCSQWTDGIFQSYRCRYTFQWLLSLPWD